MDAITQVVAALIRNSEDKILICQRPAAKARGLLWEFVGGKVEPGETGPQALVRECQEELAIELAVGPVYMEVTHTYPDLTIHLTLYEAHIVCGIPQMLEHNDLQWVTPSQLDTYEFCPADQVILHRLQAET